MRKYFVVYATLCGILFTGLLLFILMPIHDTEQEIDFVAVNEIIKQSEKHWLDLSALDDIVFPYRFVLLDSEGNVCYASHVNLPNSLIAAIRSGFLPMDVAHGTSIVGKALVETSPGDILKHSQDKQRSLTIAAFGLLCALNAAFLWALHSALVSPFIKLQSFAHKITVGQFTDPLPMDKHNLFGLFTQSFDVMRASLQEARHKQFQAEREKKELIAALSHDVKTPVTSIRIISELLQAGTTDPLAIEKLQTIEQKADQIDRLMNDLMHSALEELGELKVNPTNVESSVLRDLFLTADPLSKARIGAIPSCLVELDIMRMEQVIGNIITNSYKYAGTHIDIAFQGSGELLQVDINDTGPGVEPEELELITTKFYRGENAKETYKEGEGLGLYIAKLLMEKMGGGLEAHNRDDGFTVRLWIQMSR